MKVQRIAYVTLLEVLIALALTVIVLSTITYFYRQVDALNGEMERVQNEAFQKVYIENRLAKILPKAISPRDTRKKDFYFFTSSETYGLLKEGSSSLIFSYDNGVNLDKSLSNIVLGRLYIDKNNNFCLSTWLAPSRLKNGMSSRGQKEILMENIESVAFRFYVAPERDRKMILDQLKKGTVDKNAIYEVLPKDEWVENWKIEYRQLPAIVKVTLIKKDASEMTFVFPLPNSDMVIVYEK